MKAAEMRTPGVIVSAPQGRSGKTIATLAICSLLSQRGIVVQPFKKGPDYIDPSWLSEAAGRTCRNLDPFLMNEDIMVGSYHRACRNADLAVIEGAMGLFDGPQSIGHGSTAHLAQILDLPIILVVDCTRMTGSIAPMVKGYQDFQPNVNIAGVVCNNVSGPRHELKLRTAVEKHCKIPVIGCIPRNPEFKLKQRHLGHIPFPERASGQPSITQIASQLEPLLDLDEVLRIADVRAPAHDVSPTHSSIHSKSVRVGIFKDRAFNFYYPENLESLEMSGSELVFIDSLCDRLPDIDGLYIGGGFPEFFLEELEANQQLRHDIRSKIEDGLPVYAECAGLMYLCRGIIWKGRRYQMVGIIPADVEFTRQPQGHGYVEAKVQKPNPLFPVGLTIKGHEFHHSKLIDTGNLECAYSLERGHGIGNGMDGIIYKNVFAAYTHLHALGTSQWADAFGNLVVQDARHQPILSV